MSNIDYEVRADYFPVASRLLELQPLVKAKVEEVLDFLRTCPRPFGQFDCTETDEGYKIRVPVDEEVVTILYIVDDERRVIDLVEIKPTGFLVRIRNSLQDLIKFVPEKE